MKNKIIYLITILLVLLTIPVAYAKQNNNLYVDENVEIKEEIKKSLFTAGNNIVLKSGIDGLNFTAGNNINISSTQDYLFTAGNNINIEKATSKDMFIAGNTINISNSSIRDLYVAGSTIRIDSPVEGTIYAGGDNITLNSTVEEDVYLEASNIRIGKETVIKGTLYYPEDAEISIAESASIAKQIKSSVEDVSTKITPIDIIRENFYSYLSILLIGLLLLRFSEKLFKILEKKEKSFNEVIKTMGIGFLFLIGLPIISLCLLLTVIGVSISIISLILYVILIYLSVIPSAYYFGNMLFKDKIDNKYLLLGISLFIVYILRIVPIIGGVVSFISLLFGLGYYTELVKNNIK